jgi:zinc and cadmium transporter
MIYMHEIPQELGNFGVLIYSKMKKSRALLYNFLAQLTCVAGGILGYFLKGIGGISTLLIPFAAGGFIYISASDLIPELHKEADLRKSIEAFIFFLAGVGLMLATKFLLNG